jgi:hypothetical protein
MCQFHLRTLPDGGQSVEICQKMFFKPYILMTETKLNKAALKKEENVRMQRK